MKKLILSAIAFSSLIHPFLSAALVTQVTLVSVGPDPGDSSFLLRNELDVPLSAGNLAVEGDGFVIQLGYFSGASNNNNFSGTWVPLAGQNSANSGLGGLTFGDKVAEGANFNGGFSFTLKFSDAVANTFNSLPPSATIPLAIRFYNAGSIALATRYNTVSNDAWLWKTPGESVPGPEPSVDIEVRSSGLEWESITVEGQSASSAYHTSILIPEPTTATLGILGLAALCGVRRRRS
jgi:MYXO-CTERM domain-containing protein